MKYIGKITVKFASFFNSLPMKYVELRCERAFSVSYKAVSFVDVTKFACELLEFKRPLYVILNGVKNY